MPESDNWLDITYVNAVISTGATDVIISTNNYVLYWYVWFFL